MDPIVNIPSAASVQSPGRRLPSLRHPRFSFRQVVRFESGAVWVLFVGEYFGGSSHTSPNISGT